MAKLLYGNNVQKMCKFCSHGGGINDKGVVICKKHRNSVKTPGECCHSFNYDPLLRIPEEKPELPKFDYEDFSL